MGFLDKLPLATITFLAGTAIIVIAYISNDLSVKGALEALGYVGVGTGVLGVARNGAGRGLRGQV
jgi:hypothetical protein